MSGQDSASAPPPGEAGHDLPQGEGRAEGSSLAMPLNLQRLERALQMEPFLAHVQGILTEDIAISDDSSDGGEDKLPVPSQSGDGAGEVDQHTKILNGVIDPPDMKEERSRHYNFSKVKKSRKWLKNLLVSDSSESESEDQPISEEEYHSMLRLHKHMRSYQNRFYTDRENMQYQYYSTGLLSNYDKFHEHQRFILGPKKKRKEDKKLKAKMKKLKKLEKMEMKKMKKKSKEPEEEEEEMELADLDEETVQALLQEAAKRRRTLTLKEADARRRKVWLAICKKEINKAQRQRSSAHNNMLSNCRKMAQLCQKEVRKAAMQSQRVCKETPPRARRLTREMLVFWKKYEKVEKEHRKRAEKEAMEQRKLDDELREARRQQRKLNFLITQTELYAHFMAKKLRGEIDSRQEEILSQLEDKVPRRQVQVQGRVMELEVDDYDSELMKATALRNAQEAYDAHQAKKRAFDEEVAASKRSNQEKFDETFSLANPMMAKGDLSQPSFFNGQLKAYQLKLPQSLLFTLTLPYPPLPEVVESGRTERVVPSLCYYKCPHTSTERKTCPGLNWLANLYDQGINGILADEMGLGKTVQSIAFLAHLAEVKSPPTFGSTVAPRTAARREPSHNGGSRWVCFGADPKWSPPHNKEREKKKFFKDCCKTRVGIWGPFLVIAPASTLHNWQQECSRFVLPYWGNQHDRKVLRKFWNQKQLQMHTEDAPFHVLITSYQLVVQDVKYFQRIKWQYMVLDEAQAIKSSASVRWKILLGFSCRNRLLLTGTPIQNTMAELWALLHFIMPTLFDSHEEFNEWFSKDIEGHAENKSSPLDENQLSRLHMILKPFMLRRIKKDVENELSDKIEILVYCCLNLRQTMLYQAVKNKISIEDLLQSSAGSSSQAQSTTSSLMNLVMQFRKVTTGFAKAAFLFLLRTCLPVRGAVVPARVSAAHSQHPALETAGAVYLHVPLGVDKCPGGDHVSMVTVLLGVFALQQVCNHPELFERQEARSPLFTQPDAFILPKLVYRQDVQSESTFSFLRFMNTSPAEAHSLMLCGLLVRWLALYLTLKEAYRIHHHREWHAQSGQHRCLDRTGLLLSPCFRLSAPAVASSAVLKHLVFTSFTTNFIGHMQQTFHFIPETPGHRKRRLSKIRQLSVSHGSKSGLTSPTRAHPTPLSPTRRSSHSASSQQPAANPSRRLASPTQTPTSPRPRRHPSGSASSGEKAAPHPKSPTRHHLLLPRSPLPGGDCVPSAAPAFLTNIIPKVTSAYRLWYSSDRSAGYDLLRQQLGGAPDARPTVLHGSPESHHQHQAGGWLFPPPAGGLAAVELSWGWSNIQIPDKEVLVTDSGKLYALDILLTRLKQQGHRVLIYSQMTRMIDILEEFMWHRKHTYMRLDGSSKISDRRDMVEDFQQRSDIFVFLLSTRAGGLGINLTAADTVIFYDSDWNPTVDQQAMDRAHRLGQTKQVTVYRLICKGTIEERILQRAREKSEIQRMVISGGKFSPDTLKPKEVVSLLLDDDELEKKLRQRQEEKRLQEEAIKAKDRKRKREKYAADKRRREAAKKKKDADVVTMETAADLLLPSQENSNLSIPSMDTPEGSLISADDSAVPSPLAPSEMSVGSEAAMMGLPQDDSSNDGLLIVDDLPPQQPATLLQQPALQPAAAVTPPPQVQEAPAEKPAAGAKGKGAARGRGRPKSNKSTPAKGGNKAAGRSRKINANSAAAMAGARAGAAAASVAAFQAYGFQFSGGGTTSGASPGTPPLLRPPVFTPPPSRMASSHSTQPGSSLFSQGVGQGGPFSQTRCRAVVKPGKLPDGRRNIRRSTRLPEDNETTYRKRLRETRETEAANNEERAVEDRHIDQL
ncbi:putative DNA helicase ino80 [Branchiostoma belcheri]|nr:putative DNA helicase ino80 [Branchiostoma belcheri]